jgi:hypothetical protein
MSEDPTRPISSGWTGEEYRARGSYDGYQPGGYRAAPRRGRARRRLTILVIVVVVLLALLAVLDRVAVAYAENRAASQIHSSGFPAKPKVTIEGFPFLTQVAARDLKNVNISASNVTEGPLQIASVNATAHGVHLNSGFSGGTVDKINGTALITFAGLSHAAGIGDGITLSDAGRGEVKASVNLGFISGNALFQVTRTSPHEINIRAVSAGDIPLSALGSLRDFDISLPDLPAGMTIQNVSVTGQGLLISVAGTGTSFSQ